MRILVDITHPAHVHFFRNAINVWQQRGHEVAITARDKDITLQLLDEYGYEYACLSRTRRGIIGLGLELLEHEGKFLRIIADFKPNVLLEVGGTFIVHVGKLTRTPALVFYDTENARVSNAITYPFADAICTPSCYKHDLGPKHIRYEGYQELAYLHSNWFVPDRGVLEEVGLSEKEPFSVVRFVGWTSGHDVNLRGFSVKGKEALVNCLEQFGRVIITSEAPLPARLEKHRMGISPTKIHDLLFFASLYVGESATMASESAILGTPAIFVSPVGRGYTDEQEHRYGLVCNFSNQAEDAAMDKASEWFARDNLKDEWRTKQDRMLKEKIDVTAWMVDFVDKWG